MIIEISVLVASISVLALVLFLIPSIIQLRKSARRIEEVSGHLNQQLPEILKNVNQISSNLNFILSSGRQQAEKLGEAASSIKIMVDDIVDFETKLRHRVEDPLIETLTTITAITKAVRAFLAILLNRR